MSKQTGKAAQEPDESAPAEDSDVETEVEAEAEFGAETDADAGGALEPGEEPIEAEFEPAESPLSQLLSMQVTMPVVLGLFALAAVLGGLFGMVLGGGGSSGDAARIERLVDERLAGMDERFAALRQAIAESGGEGSEIAAAALADLEGEIAALRDRVLVVESASGDGGASAELSDQLAQINADLADLRLDGARIAAIDEQLAEVSADVAAQAREINQLTDTTGALARRATGVAPPPGRASAGAAAALAYANLEEAARSGETFLNEAQAAARYFPDSAAMAQLLLLSERGAPPPTELAASFRSAARAARNAEGPAGGGFVDRMARMMTSIVTVRRLDAPPTDTPADVVVRAQRRLSENDLAGAAAEMARLDGAAGEAVAAWVADAEARASIEMELDALAQSFAEG
ncbi:MAG: hypothetical protein PVI23_06610 [Maricaulaceae bacterium]|jgi:hypothetical protein